jgi:hypothetical protein
MGAGVVKRWYAEKGRQVNADKTVSHRRIGQRIVLIVLLGGSRVKPQVALSASAHRRAG